MHGLIKKDEFVMERMREALPVGASPLMADRLAWELDINLQAGKKIFNW